MGEKEVSKMMAWQTHKEKNSGLLKVDTIPSLLKETIFCHRCHPWYFSNPPWHQLVTRVGRTGYPV